ncbi:MAG: zinc-binding dehydrogenase [Chloroflexi bacterium]|nr:MAG: zinc-binding dehydrogenase [Chloroflexota bacterium]
MRGKGVLADLGDRASTRQPDIRGISRPALRGADRLVLRAPAEDSDGPAGAGLWSFDAFPRTKRSDLLALKELAESGALRPVIDRRYTLDEIVEAHRYVDLGHKRGNVIVTISPR